MTAEALTGKREPMHQALRQRLSSMTPQEYTAFAETMSAAHTATGADLATQNGQYASVHRKLHALRPRVEVVAP